MPMYMSIDLQTVQKYTKILILLLGTFRVVHITFDYIVVLNYYS